MALCGVLAAASAALLLLGGIMPLAMFCCPVLAVLTMIPVVEEYRTGTALLFYAAVSVLGLLLSPDKECALVFAFLGYYPAIRQPINRKITRRLPRVLVKCVLFFISAAALYLAAAYLFSLNDLTTAFQTTAALLLAAEMAVGGAVFLVCDALLERFTVLYRKHLRPRLFHTR